MNTKYLKSGIYYEIAVTTDSSGRTSITVTENPHINNGILIDVELPPKTGEFKDSFKPTVRARRIVEIEKMQVTNE